MYQKLSPDKTNVISSLSEDEMPDPNYEKHLAKQNLNDSKQPPVSINLEEQVKLAEFKKNACSFFLLFFFIGLLNNNTYGVINTGAQDLAEKFGKKNLMGAFQM